MRFTIESIQGVTIDLSYPVIIIITAAFIGIAWRYLRSLDK